MSDPLLNMDEKILERQQYKPDRLRGRGGQGRVWQAFSVRQHETVAVKLLSSHGMPSQDFEWRRELLQQEFAVLDRFRGGNVLRVFEWGDDFLSGVRYSLYSMQLCDRVVGRSLHRAGAHTAYTNNPFRGSSSGASQPRLQLDERVAITALLAEDLASLHLRGISHRDIKPDNLLLADRNVKICDFGLAKVQHQVAATPSGKNTQRAGTTLYMAPERWRRYDPDQVSEQDWRMSDMYACGLTIFEILTNGRLPPKLELLRHGTCLDRDVRRAHESGVFAPVESPELPGQRLLHVDEVLKRMLAYDPGDRYSDMARCSSDYRAALVHDGLPQSLVRI